MANDSINDGIAFTSDGGKPVYYSLGYSSPVIQDVTFQICGPGGLAGYNPPGTAFIEYFDPYTNQTVVQTILIGGQIGSSLVTVTTGSMYPGDSLGQINITIVDNPNIPGAGPGAKFIGSLGKVMKALGYVGNAIDGVFGVPGYAVSHLTTNPTALSFGTSYAPGFLESLGFDPDTLPSWLLPVFDASGNFVGIDVQMCFAAGTAISMYDGRLERIEAIHPGDFVLSYNATGDLVPGRVTRTFRNEASHLLDVHGLKVTPGHATLCGDGMFKGRHVPIIDILLSDGALVRADGTLIRMAINAPVGSLADAFVKVAVARTPEDMKADTLTEGDMRVGTLLFDREGVPISVLDCLNSEGYAFDPETGLIAKPGEAPHPLFWFGRLPRPEDYILTRSQETLEGILVDGEWEGTRP